MIFRFLLILALLFTSCRTIKTNYGWDEEEKITKTDRQQTREKTKHKVVIDAERIKSEDGHSVDEESDPLSYDTKKTDGDSYIEDQHIQNKFKSESKDTLNKADIQEAYWAERQAVTASTLGATGVAASIFLPPLGLALLILALVFYIRGNRSRFITKRGERLLRGAKITMIISGAILLLWTGLLTLAIFF